jgi:hypothetical protein
LQNTGSTPIYRKFTYAHLLALCGLFAFLDTFAFGITDQDEGLYSTVARGMVQAGNFLVPRINGKPWFEKPPLLYWCSASSMKILGFSAVAFRLPSVLAFIAILIMLVVWGNKRLGKNVGYFAGLIFAASPLTMYLARVGLTDMVMACCLIAAVISMWETARRPAWSTAWGAAAGLSILAKGPVGFGLIGAQWLLSFGLLRKQGFRARWMIVALLVALGVAAPWYAAIWLRYGSRFFNEFIVHQNLSRLAGGDTAHAVTQPVLYLIYYVLIIAIGLFPFSMFTPGRGEVSPANAYLRRWCWLVFGLFTLSKTKLPHYILPMLPALALVIADSVLTRAGIPSPLEGEGIPERSRRGKGEGETAQACTCTRTAKATLRRVGVAFFGLILIVGLSALSVMWHYPLLILSAVGFAGICLPIVLRGSMPFGPDSPPFHPAALLVFLVGFHVAFCAYDAMELRPIRTLALSAPANSPLVVYNLPHDFPSIYFYRGGDPPTVQTSDKALALGILSEGGCGFALAGREPAGDWQIIERSHTHEHKYELFREAGHR